MNKNLVSMKNFVKKHERKILITTNVIAIGGVVMMRTGIAQHNDFLREHGLFEAFYDLGES